MIDPGAMPARRAPKRLALGILLLVAGCEKGETAVEQAVLFSAVEGEVRKGGRALPGATLVREWVFAENKVRGRDEAVTDARGQFAFPAVTHAYRKPRFFAQETFIEQRIIVHLGAAEWQAWWMSKRDIEPSTEALAEPHAQTPPRTPPAVPLRVIIDLDLPVAKRGSVIGHTLFGTGS